MIKRRNKSITLIVIISIFLCVHSTFVIKASNYTELEMSITDTYKEILNAKERGMNVTDLIFKMNEALPILMDINYYNIIGETDIAKQKEDVLIQILIEIEKDALSNINNDVVVQNKFINVLFFNLFIIALVFVLIKLINGYYIDKISKLKPEVVR